jgi:hypothetical protein
MRPPSVGELKRFANAVGISLSDAAVRGLKVASPPSVGTVLLLTGRQTESYYV